MPIRSLKVSFICVDVGMIVYWTFALFGLFPRDWLFKDYDNPILQAWNYSFLPLDLLVSLTGFSALFCHARRLDAWRQLALVSLTLTSCSGLPAIAFWALRGDFDVSWWVPNLFLLCYPFYFMPAVMHGRVDPQRRRLEEATQAP